MKTKVQKSPRVWMKENLFQDPLQTFLTVLGLAILLAIFWSFLDWAVFSATWNSGPELCREKAGGACWSFIQEKFRPILFGPYPYEQHWRPALVLILFFLMIFFTRLKGAWQKRPTVLVSLWIFYFLFSVFFLQGGFLGLPAVEREAIGGLPLTLMLSLGGIGVSYPMGILLALGRRSPLPVVRSLSTAYIELIRGVPLISLLFMASVMLPLFLPPGTHFDKVWRAQVALILFYSAYMAEVVRGGLQAIPKGQYEAAESLGLHYPQIMRRVILPQALKVVIPPTVNTSIGLFKDTSLVVIISLFDLLSTMKLAQKDALWGGFEVESYVFVGTIYFAFCFFLSRFGSQLESSLSTRGR